MADYIDREAIKYEQWAFGPYNGPLKIVRKTTIDSIPAADVAPVVHGYWIDNGANGYKWAFICSSCGYVDGHPFDDRHNFCPSCGAIMDGGKNDAVD